HTARDREARNTPVEGPCANCSASAHERGRQHPRERGGDGRHAGDADQCEDRGRKSRTTGAEQPEHDADAETDHQQLEAVHNFSERDAAAEVKDMDLAITIRSTYGSPA